jgi:uncharacterized membrane protein
MFFISVLVIGSFWLAHHRYVAKLVAFDRPTTYVNLIYLGLIAFLPFPSAVLGQYTDNAVGVTFYALAIVVVALASNLLGELSRHRKLHTVELPPQAARWRRAQAAIPIAVFLLSIPVAFLSRPLEPSSAGC